MKSRFFEGTKGKVERSPAHKLEAGGLISIVNKDDFQDDPMIVGSLGQLRENLNSSNDFKRMVCEPEEEGDDQFTCEAVGDFRAREHAPMKVEEFLDVGTFMRDVVVRFSDMDQVRIKTDTVDFEDGELML